ncbi:MAG TPA: anthranilate phosphoribosyltransferase [Acidimicrobiia bacterium]|nr:anthranilate phosphoribosyltransferase [Acidimicrobiia bacterium]
MSDFSWPATIGALIECKDLTRPVAAQAMAEIMAGRASDAQISAFIVALRTKRESADEMAGMVDAMIDAAVTANVPNSVDIVGTGGDGFGTFNVSTTAAFIAAGAGVRVAKHGNRAASSTTGSADLLEALGFNIEIGPDQVAQMVDDSNFGFFFAPRYHPAMRHAVGVRRDLGVRTVFNFLGPLCNPAGARMSVGVSDPRMAEVMIEVLAARGVDRAFVVYGEEGLDELSPAGPSRIYRLIDGEVTEAEFTPEDFGIRRSRIEDIVGGDSARNVVITRSILDGRTGPQRDAAVINAAPAIILGGLADGFARAVEVAEESIDSGAANRALESSLTINEHVSRSPA